MSEPEQIARAARRALADFFDKQHGEHLKGQSMSAEPTWQTIRDDPTLNDQGYGSDILSGVRITSVKKSFKKGNWIYNVCTVNDGQEDVEGIIRTKAKSPLIRPGATVNLTGVGLRNDPQYGESFSAFLGKDQPSQAASQPASGRAVDPAYEARQQRGYCVNGLLGSPWMANGQWDANMVCETADILARYIMTGKVPVADPREQNAPGPNFDPENDPALQEVPEY